MCGINVVNRNSIFICQLVATSPVMMVMLLDQSYKTIMSNSLPLNQKWHKQNCFKGWSTNFSVIIIKFIKWNIKGKKVIIIIKLVLEIVFKFKDDLFFYFSFIFCRVLKMYTAVCPTKDTRQRAFCRLHLCHVLCTAKPLP